ncbi:MAG: hypothetical protein E7556_00795 [Ruminococcaceae bacterium]|nr:hypothetical protein [Oscillospiraceae bacterium]
MKYVYKIVSALCALAVLPLVVFSPMIYYYFSSTALQSLFTVGQLLGNETLSNAMDKFGLETVPTGMANNVSIYDLFDLFMRFKNIGNSSEIAETVAQMIPSLIATFIAIALTLITAIVIVVLAFACKDNRKVIAASFAGIGFSLMVKMLFENAVSPLVNGEITITDFIDSAWASLIAEVEIITLNSTFYFIPITFGFIALWTILYNATLPEKEKEERKKMIG